MTKEKPKYPGLHDPWRVGSPEWEPPKDDAPAGTKKSKLDFDWDLQPEKVFVLRQPGASIKVIGTDTAEGAVARLLQAYTEDMDICGALSEAGFKLGSEEAATGFTLHTGGHALYCAEAKSADEGLQRLCRALRRIVRTGRDRNCLQRWGIVPLLR